MGSLEGFEAALKEVIHAKRLSASKMEKLTEIALKTMEHDTQLVSMLYRTHKSLPSSAKVRSLYVFDALARAARHQVNKQGSSGRSSQTGDCSSFLLKVEGVLEGLFQDMISSGSSESMEKTKKIHDIWVKGSTFPPAILARLTDVLIEKEKVSVNEVKPIKLSSSEHAVPHPPPLSASSVTPAVDPQAALLALLTQAANSAVAATNLQTAANITTGAPQLDPDQLAVLQQLAQTAVAAPPVTSNISSSATVQQSYPIFEAGSSRSPPSLPGPSYKPGINDTRPNRNRSLDRGRDPEIPPNESMYSAGRFRGGHRGRVRGDNRRRWDSRDRHRDQERDWAPPLRGGRSRSRSPPSRYGGRRDVKPSSPPRRPSRPLNNEGKTLELGKDEFGRDIRPQSPEDQPPAASSEPSHPISLPVDKPILESSIALTSNHDRNSMSPLVAGNTSSSTPSTIAVTSSDSPQPGMEQFDLATFTFTSPSSWEALGKMWQVTNGYLPTTEQLMEFVLSLQASQAGMESAWTGWDTSPSGEAQIWGNENQIGAERRGDFVHDKGRNGQDGWNHKESNSQTDAIVLNAGSVADTSHSSTDQGGPQLLDQDDHVGPQSGRMQRVGDKWVFVRGPVASIS